MNKVFSLIARGGFLWFIGMGVIQAAPTQGEAVPLGPAESTGSGYSCLEACVEAPGPIFRTGYFGMPMVWGPYQPGQKELRVILGDFLWVLVEDGSGFRTVRREHLPRAARAAEIRTGGGETYVPVDSALRGEADPIGILPDPMDEGKGFQIGERGDLHWIGERGIYKLGEGKGAAWKRIWKFPKPIADRRGPVPGTALVLLPGSRVAVINAPGAFIRILQIGSDPDAELPELANCSYQSIRCGLDDFSRISGVQYCVSMGQLYFYLNETGRLFRMDLTSYELKEFRVPWPTLTTGRSGVGFRWTNPDHRNPAYPVIPESLAFTPTIQGSVRVVALMYNMPMVELQAFELDSEGREIKFETVSPALLPNPFQYQGPDGNLMPLDDDALGIQPPAGHISIFLNY